MLIGETRKFSCADRISSSATVIAAEENTKWCQDGWFTRHQGEVNVPVAIGVSIGRNIKNPSF